MMQTGYYNNNMGWGYPGNGGQTFNPAKVTQTLSAEEMEKLRRKDDVTSIALTTDQLLRSRCVHKNRNGSFALTQLNNGDVRCEICGAVFNMDEIPIEQLKDALAIVDAALQQIKSVWLDMPEALGREYFPIIEMLKKVVPLYQIAYDHFNRFNGGIVINQGYGQQNGFDAMNSVISYGGAGYYGPAGYGVQYGGQPQGQMQQQQQNAQVVLINGQQYVLGQDGQYHPIAPQAAPAVNVTAPNVTVNAPTGAPAVGSNPFGVEGTAQVATPAGVNNATAYNTTVTPPTVTPPTGDAVQVERQFNI